jgi:hypothetical protein
MSTIGQEHSAFADDLGEEALEASREQRRAIYNESPEGRQRAAERLIDCARALEHAARLIERDAAFSRRIEDFRDEIQQAADSARILAKDL